MKNVSLKSKIAMLIGMLSVTVLAVAIVGVFELRRTNEQMRLLVDRDNRAIHLASQARVTLLAALRAEKNAVMSSDDANSTRFAQDARNSVQSQAGITAELQTIIATAGVGGSRLEEFQRNWDLLVANQNEVLDLAVLNTNVKARHALREELSPRVQVVVRLMHGIQARQMNPKVTGEEPLTVGRLEKREHQVALATRDVVLTVSRLEGLTYSHIDADEDAAMNEFDAEIEKTFGAATDNLERLKAFVADEERTEIGQALMILQELRPIAARIQSLSRE